MLLKRVGRTEGITRRKNSSSFIIAPLVSAAWCPAAALQPVGRDINVAAPPPSLQAAAELSLNCHIPLRSALF